MNECTYATGATTLRVDVQHGSGKPRARATARASAQEAASAPCPGGFACGTSRCNTSCASDTDCASGYACSKGACSPAVSATCAGSVLTSPGGKTTDCAPYNCESGGYVPDHVLVGRRVHGAQRLRLERQVRHAAERVVREQLRRARRARPAPAPGTGRTGAPCLAGLGTLAWVIGRRRRGRTAT